MNVHTFPEAPPSCLPSAAQRRLLADPGQAFGARQLAWCLLLAGAFGAPPMTGHAQTATPAAPAAPVTKVTAKPLASGPTWSELQPVQQQALKPLAQSWDSISEAQKRKWLQVSRGYGSLSLQGQATMHSRMNDWVQLSPQQRAQARLNFAQTRELSRQLTPEEKKAKWQSYQALSVEEKQQLAATASPRPAGAATAVKPVPVQKLAPVQPKPAKASTAAGGKPALKIAPSPSAPGAATPLPAASSAS